MKPKKPEPVNVEHMIASRPHSNSGEIAISSDWAGDVFVSAYSNGEIPTVNPAAVSQRGRCQASIASNGP